jgi:PAS domain S-box-containing protein
MQPFRDIPIKRKLTLIIMLTSSITLLVACGAFVTQEFIAFRTGRMGELSTMADIISANASAALAFSDRYSAKEMLAALRAEKHVLAACIYRTDGTMFADYYLREGENTGLLPPAPREPGEYFEGHDLLLFRRIYLDGETIGTIYLRSDMRVVYSRLQSYTGVVALVMATSWIVAFVLSSRLQQIVSDPILRLARAARRVSTEKNYSVRVTKRSDDELGLLTDAFNEMLSQIAARTGELTESEERFRRLFEEAPVAYHEIDRAGIVRRVNRAECLLLGCQPREIIGKHVWEFLASEEREKSRELVRQRLPGDQPLPPFHCEYLRKDGARFSIEVHENFIWDADGQAVGVRSALLDITERKRAEQALSRQADELARSNSELEQFAYVASHDLQEPLRKIQAFGDRLQIECSQQISDRANDYLARMQSAAARMHILINDLLELSRVKTRTQPFVRVDLSEVTQVVLSDLETRIEQLGARIEAGALPTIDADPVQMTQLLQNLIGNALKFHKKQEAPVVKIQAEILSGEACRVNGNGNGNGASKLCRLTVEDNGIGFDEKYLGRIFQVFQRLHGRSEYEGTGVGLAICRGIADRHGGTITAHSAPDQGAQFIVTLPLEQHHEPNPL